MNLSNPGNSGGQRRLCALAVCGGQSHTQLMSEQQQQLRAGRGRWEKNPGGEELFHGLEVWAALEGCLYMLGQWTKRPTYSYRTQGRCHLSTSCHFQNWMSCCCFLVSPCSSRPHWIEFTQWSYSPTCLAVPVEYLLWDDKGSIYSIPIRHPAISQILLPHNDSLTVLFDELAESSHTGVKKERIKSRGFCRAMNGVWVLIREMLW